MGNSLLSFCSLRECHECKDKFEIAPHIKRYKIMVIFPSWRWGENYVIYSFCSLECAKACYNRLLKRFKRDKLIDYSKYQGKTDYAVCD